MKESIISKKFKEYRYDDFGGDSVESDSINFKSIFTYSFEDSGKKIEQIEQIEEKIEQIEQISDSNSGIKILALELDEIEKLEYRRQFGRLRYPSENNINIR